jgi:hypothetical protein
LHLYLPVPQGYEIFRPYATGRELSCLFFHLVFVTQPKMLHLFEQVSKMLEVFLEKLLI